MRSTNETLAEGGPLHHRLEQAITSYRAARDRLETIDDRGSVPGGGPDRIKCAHAHTAHGVATGDNPVAALAMSSTGWPDCREPCFKVER